MSPEPADIRRSLLQHAEFEPEVILDEPLDPRRGKGAETGQLLGLSQLEREVLTCRKCVLSEKRSNVVFGVGHPNADLMFIGEGPGADEDRQGIPFVGRAGKLLDRIIVAMKMKREEVYIANIVKCRPPENRNPFQDEALTCLPYIEQQIKLIQPDVIVALGLTAAVYLLDVGSTVSVKSMRERIHNYNGIPLVVTYHPAALLRSPAYKAPTWQDMQMVMKLLSGELKWTPPAI